MPWFKSFDQPHSRPIAVIEALGIPRLPGNVAHALLAVVTKKVENLEAFGPKSHVGLSSER